MNGAVHVSLLHRNELNGFAYLIITVLFYTETSEHEDPLHAPSPPIRSDDLGYVDLLSRLTFFVSHPSLTLEGVHSPSRISW